MRKIALNHKKHALIDNDDFERVSKYNWCFDKSNGYVVGNVGKIKDSLHRVIMMCPKGKMVDHINGNKLDNRKENLRICNFVESNRNVGLSKNNKSGFKGVVWDKVAKKWKAQISVNYKCLFLGYFIDKLDAARKYNEAAKVYHGEYANLNKI